MAQLHKKFTDSQVKELIERYLRNEIKRSHLQEILGIKRRRFCTLVNMYRNNPDSFSIQYCRKKPSRSIDQNTENNILKELKVEQKLIKNKDIPIKCYNYSFIKNQLERNHKQKVSLPTIINRAKQHGFYFKRPKRKAHDREVLTNYAGELIQHDTSFHLWAPHAREKWYLITSLDDFSRFILYAILIKKESSWAHIMALQSIFLRYGIPYSFYVDSHSIFRFVQGRDSRWRKHYLLTDDVDTQWEQVMGDCKVNVIHALSPQAKGKIERPYSWIQDHLVRLCVRDNVTEIKDARAVLADEIHQYNYHRIHSTIKEIPYIRLKKALKDKQTLFRPFAIKPPFRSLKDIFCLRMDRTTNAYRKISINNIELRVNHAPVCEKINLRIYPNEKTGLSEIRFWHKDKLLDIQKLKNEDLNIVHF